MRDTERGRDTGRGTSRLHAGSPKWDSIPGLQDQLLSHSGVPMNQNLKSVLTPKSFPLTTMLSCLPAETHCKMFPVR